MAVTATTEDRIGYITLDRPPANSYDRTFIEELGAATDQLDSDDDVRVIVVRSSSEKFFSAGADVKNFAESDADTNNDMVRLAHRVFDRFGAIDKLTIAAINGHALGGGYEIALACDVRIAAEGRYRIGLPEVTLGLLPGTGGTQRLPRLIGRGRALLLMTTGTSVTPDEAARLGMVDRLVPAEELTDHVREVASTIARGAPLAIAATKRAVHRGVDRPLAEGLQIELDELAPLFGSEDGAEGMAAFLEKRSPEYQGR
ncbi:enoyl-CoA hydratase/isomerase family protein [Nitriliruptor alkaliphilus]|uniref:enoyl-CoA hydratase/isomerase family protein n=1 Tax=Nitriliruptor alkaliphilus TaxID=427918 RepID=UPI0006967918|nr:enoyl-CoA hydratase-related protein [Nitriliruptor alkaliphilus]